MKIENQVVTIEQAKKLKELGVTQDTLYAFYHHWEINKMVYSLMLKDSDSINESFAAPTVAELGVMLPNYYESHKGAMDDTWYCGMLEGGDGEYFAIEKTESEARAAMLIYLLENHLTTPEEVNQRLNK